MGVSVRGCAKAAILIAASHTGAGCDAALPEGPAPFTTPVERCIVPAAQYHGVNQFVLRAILRVESGLQPRAENANRNGTKDRGIAQINSIHDPALRAQGIVPDMLFDECVGTYVGAWLLSKQMRQHGNNWEAIARYHSSDPYLNWRYRVLLNNELVRSRVLDGELLPVPPLPDRRAGGAGAAEAARTSAVRSTASMVFDTSNSP